MKKGFKILGAFILAAAIGTGGYFAGQKTEQNRSSIHTAMPKQSMELTKDNVPGDKNPDMSGAPLKDAAAMEESRLITKLASSAIDESWTKVSGNSINGGALTLYTSAEKDDMGFIWDDSQKWVLEFEKDGGYYTLYDQLVSNGMVYYDAAIRENGEIVITVYTVTTAGTTVMQYAETNGGFTERSVYNSGAVNKIFSSVPDYR